MTNKQTNKPIGFIIFWSGACYFHYCGAGNGVIIQSYTFSESPLNFLFIDIHCNNVGQLKKYLWENKSVSKRWKKRNVQAAWQITTSHQNWFVPFVSWWLLMNYAFSESPLNFLFIDVHYNNVGQLKKYLWAKAYPNDGRRNSNYIFGRDFCGKKLNFLGIS